MKKPHDSRRELRGNPFLSEKVHDPYHARGKLTDGAACPECGAHYHKGHWTWAESKKDVVDSELCPACRRIKDRYPAGELILSGKFLLAHRDEIMARARHVEEAERAQHPLHRIMSVEEGDGVITIRTTDVHLPHRIGHALTAAWDGAMTTHYDLDGYFTRVQWERND